MTHRFLLTSARFPARSQAVPVICAQLYDLARISQHPLTQEEMTKFMKRSNEIMMLLTK